MRHVVQLTLRFKVSAACWPNAVLSQRSDASSR